MVSYFFLSRPKGLDAGRSVPQRRCLRRNDRQKRIMIIRGVHYLSHSISIFFFEMDRTKLNELVDAGRICALLKSGSPDRSRATRKNMSRYCIGDDAVCKYCS